MAKSSGSPVSFSTPGDQSVTVPVTATAVVTGPTRWPVTELVRSTSPKDCCVVRSALSLTP